MLFFELVFGLVFICIVVAVMFILVSPKSAEKNKNKLKSTNRQQFDDRRDTTHFFDLSHPNCILND